MMKSKPGKHGAAKIRFVAVDLITNKKREETFGSQDMIDVPVVKKEDMLVSSVNWEDELVTVTPIVAPTKPNPAAALAERPLSKKDQRKARQKVALAEEDPSAASTPPSADLPEKTPPKPLEVPKPTSFTLPLYDESLREKLQKFDEEKSPGEIILVTVITAMGERAVYDVKKKKA